MRPDFGQDRTDVEQVFNKYLQSLDAADVALASNVWLQSPDVLVVTPLGRFKGWDGVNKRSTQRRSTSTRSGTFRPATSASSWQAMPPGSSMILCSQRSWLMGSLS